MKRLMMLFLPMALVAAMAACGNADQDQTQTGTESDSGAEQNTDQQNTDGGTDTGQADNSTGTDNASDDQEYMKSKMDELDFSKIDMEVSYGKDKEYEIEIEQDANQPIEAKVEDELNNEYLRGKEAFDSIYPKAQNLSLSNGSPKQEVIDQVLKAFSLPKDYQKFDVEITYKDGSKLDVEDRK